MIIYKYPHPLLKKKSTHIGVITDDIRELAESMLAFVKDEVNQCVGLSAVQVGRPIRMFVTKQIEPNIVINPSVMYRGGGTSSEIEACMSLPGDFIKVRRPNNITLHGYDINGKSFEKKFIKMDARVVQHEFDHLEGILISDYD